MAKPTIAIDTESPFKADQSVYYVSLLRIFGRRLRVRIRYNAYVDQSYGVVECWTGDKWSEVYTLEGAELAGWKSGHYTMRDTPTASLFAADVLTLRQRAAVVLRISGGDSWLTAANVL